MHSRHRRGFHGPEPVDTAAINTKAHQTAAAGVLAISGLTRAYDPVIGSYLPDDVYSANRFIGSAETGGARRAWGYSKYLHNKSSKSIDYFIDNNPLMKLGYRYVPEAKSAVKMYRDNEDTVFGTINDVGNSIFDGITGVNS